MAAIVGLDNRATMDLDTTAKNIPLTKETIEKVIQEICDIDCDDNIVFFHTDISTIRDNDFYGGYRVMLGAKYDTIFTPLSIDISTGDVITPSPEIFTFYEVFNNSKSYDLMAYIIETTMAEKVETILRRTVYNTRPRDYYDVYILATTQTFDETIFHDALSATSHYRGTLEQIKDMDRIIKNIAESKELRTMWDKYRKQFDYAKDIDFDDIITVISNLLKRFDIQR